MQENDVSIKDIESNVFDIEELSYFGNFECLTNLLIKWESNASKSDNDRIKQELKEAANAFFRISIYVSQMQARQREFNLQISGWRRATLKAKKEALDLREKLNNIKNNI